MERLRGINVSKVADSITMENRLKKLSANRERNAGVKKEELPFKGISLADQKIEVEGIVNPKESYFFNKGREIAEKLVRNNIANMENYADFCKVETRKTRNGR